MTPREIARNVYEDPIYQLIAQHPIEIIEGLIEVAENSKAEDYDLEKIEGLIGLSVLALKMVLSSKKIAAILAEAS